MWIFDRDDTLLDENMKLIDPFFIFAYLQTLRNANIPWAIASAGPIELEVDDAYVAISAALAFTEQQKPHYIQFSGIQSVLKHVIDYSDVNFISTDPNADPDNRIICGKIILDAVYKKNCDSPQQIIISNNIRFTFTDNSAVQIKLGETKITLNIKSFMEAIAEHEKGRYKLFMVLAALDKAKLKVSINDGLRSLGVVAIEAPEAYRLIRTSEVVFTDDKIANCSLIQKAGFKSIIADPPYLQKSSEKEVDTMDTYKDKLLEALTQEQRAAFKVNFLRLKINRAVVGHFEVANAMTIQANPKVDNFLYCMSINTSGIHFNKKQTDGANGGSANARKLLASINNPSANETNIIEAVRLVHIETGSSENSLSLSQYLSSIIPAHSLPQPTQKMHGKSLVKK